MGETCQSVAQEGRMRTETSQSHGTVLPRSRSYIDIVDREMGTRRESR